jgi:hypothetical protein
MLNWDDNKNLQARIAHLGFIQGVINRMGLNSFLAKGWTATLTAAVFALSDRKSDARFILIALLPVAMLWLLDAFFLHEEKLFRKLYEKVASGAISSQNFSMDTRNVRKEVGSEIQVFFSKTLLLYYGTIVGALLFAIFALLRR